MSYKVEYTCKSFDLSLGIKSNERREGEKEKKPGDEIRSMRYSNNEQREKERKGKDTQIVEWAAHGCGAFYEGP